MRQPTDTAPLRKEVHVPAVDATAGLRREGMVSPSSPNASMVVHSPPPKFSSANFGRLLSPSGAANVSDVGALPVRLGVPLRLQ